MLRIVVASSNRYDAENTAKLIDKINRVIIPSQPIDAKNQLTEDKAICIGCCTNADEAEELIKNARADILIVSMSLLGGGGLDLIKKVRSHSRRIEIIATINSKKYDVAVELMRYQVVDLLLETIDEDELSVSISKAAEKIQNNDSPFNMCRLLDETDVKNGNFIAKAITYLERHYKEKVTLDNVAKSLYISSWHLCKLFKKHTGKSFIDVLNLIRMSHAREFLRTSSLKIGEIARYVGYPDVAYFTVLFKKINGMTPLKYRTGKNLNITLVPNSLGSYADNSFSDEAAFTLENSCKEDTLHSDIANKIKKSLLKNIINYDLSK